MFALMENSSKRIWSGPQLDIDYDITGRTRARWIETGVLPPPDFYINQSPYWRQETLEANEQRLAEMGRPDFERRSTANLPKPKRRK
jgi:hypothetical protein